MGKRAVQALLGRGPVLFDGAMGTYYAARGGGLEKCELGNRTRPDLIGEIHRAYLAAGCRAVKSNTFALPAVAAEEGPAEALDLLRRGWAIAQEAVSGGEALLFADLGPIHAAEPRETWAVYQGLLDAFLDLGAQHFLFETFGSDTLIREAAAYIRRREPDAYILASFAVDPDGFTQEGLSGRGLVEGVLADGAADAAGYNCISGPEHLLRAARKLADLSPLSIMPNAGYPTVVGGRTVYSSSPGYFAQKLLETARAGARFLGGCCGTTPAFIQAAAEALYGGRPVQRIPAAPQTPERAGRPDENRLREKLMRGERVVAVELDSPLDSDITKYMAGARQLQQAGVDCITIADCPVARSRMDSSIVACKIRRELGMDAMPHLTCRDRNLNATKALLLGLSCEGVHTVLIVTGDPVPSAQRDAVKSVYNFNSRMLIRYVRQLGEEVLQTPFLIGGALNINAANFDVQLRLAQEKAESGAELFLTQPVLTDRGTHNLRRARDVLDAKILGGILPVVSYRNARFLASELQGIEIAPETVERYRDLSKAESTALATELSLEMARRIAGDVDGYYLITPFQRTDIICAILENL